MPRSSGYRVERADVACPFLEGLLVRVRAVQEEGVGTHDEVVLALQHESQIRSHPGGGGVLCPS